MPSVDRLLLGFDEAIEQFGRKATTSALREALGDRRKRIVSGEPSSTDEIAIRQTALKMLRDGAAPGLRRVFNLTGTVLHTNLGRAILPAEAIEAIKSVATDYSNLEFDLDSGKRGDRETHVEKLLCELTGAEAATVVNNNAAAVLLVLNTLAMNREVPVSRGELVEIGGSFRIPEVMQRANCTLIEVGTTNRTHLKDFRDAINDQSALLMKVHTSNYKIVGFSSEVDLTGLVSIGEKHKIPVMEDLGSGALIDLSRYGLPKEPVVAERIALGADIITFSGDKILGGPQAGLVVGKKVWVSQMNKNPLKRALRCGKLTLGALEATLRLYQYSVNIADDIPTLKAFTRSLKEIEEMSERLLPPLQKALGQGFHLVLEKPRE
ncbi:MAG: L-seryl-tRNA(Sec) selenium transferase [Proteobacteria bacterium]|nr:L-seryl-tRNA(Sec) selenium transferase [Pseudomonadota bacterium]